MHNTDQERAAAAGHLKEAHIELRHAKGNTWRTRTLLHEVRRLKAILDRKSP